MTRSEFTQRMLKLGGLRYQPSTLDGHWELVKDRPDEHIDAAIRASLEQPAFPTPAEFKDHVVSAQIEASESKPVGCARCNYTGFEAVFVDAVERVRRCACWNIYMLRTAPEATPNPEAFGKIRSKVASIASRKGMR